MRMRRWQSGNGHMAQIRLKGINRVCKRLSDGAVAVYYYHRATGTRLPDDLHSPEFLIAYAETEKITPKDTGTVAGLIRKYLGSLKFERKRETTKREYRRILTGMEAEFGTMPQRALASPKVRGVSGDRYSCFFDLTTWRDFVTAAGFMEVRHFFRPAGLPRYKQPWLATVLRKG